MREADCAPPCSSLAFSRMFIDIFVPYWGDPALLRETVVSVVNQDRADWRLTVLDDAYHDPWAGAWLTGLGDDRIRYLRNETNLGIVNNYRRCLREAQGELVVLLGCDDVMLPNYVRSVLAAHQRFPEAAVIQPGVQVIDETGHVVQTLADRVKRWFMPKVSTAQALAGDSLAASLLHGNWLYWPSLCFRRSKLNGIDFQDDMKLTHDLGFVLDLVFGGEQLVFAPEVCFSYRRHSGSASNANLFDGRRFSDEKRCFVRARHQAQRQGWHSAQRAAAWHITSRLNALVMALTALRLGRGKTVLGLLRHAFGG